MFVVPGAADAWLKPVEPVLALQVNGDARAYPLQILIWHEIVNDTIGGRPVALTYCPFCNSGLVFDRLVDGRTRVTEAYRVQATPTVYVIGRDGVLLGRAIGPRP